MNIVNWTQLVRRVQKNIRQLSVMFNLVSRGNFTSSVSEMSLLRSVNFSCVFFIFFVQSLDEECNRFKKVKKINSFRDELKRKNLDEIVILDNRGKLKTACYTEDAGM